MATQINWKERTDDEIVYDNTNELGKGCNVDLNWDGVTVTAKVIGNEGTNWTGEITNINNDENEHGDLKIGSQIQFEDRHVFRCAA